MRAFVSSERAREQEVASAAVGMVERRTRDHEDRMVGAVAVRVQLLA